MLTLTHGNQLTLDPSDTTYTLKIEISLLSIQLIMLLIYLEILQKRIISYTKKENFHTPQNGLHELS